MSRKFRAETTDQTSLDSWSGLSPGIDILDQTLTSWLPTLTAKVSFEMALMLIGWAPRVDLVHKCVT